MTFAGFIALLPAVFKFFDEITWFVKTLQNTPQEKRQALMEKMKVEADNYEKNSRPTW